MVQTDLARIQKLDEKKWKEIRKKNYLSSKTLKRNKQAQEIVSLVGDFSMENSYESDIDDISKTGEHRWLEEQ